MAERTNHERSKGIFYYFAMVALALIVCLTVNANNAVQAQEKASQGPSPKELAATQWTLKYRFGKDLKVGDWVTYQITQEGVKTGELELKVTEQENGGVWIVEKFGGGNELHFLVDLKEMRLLKAFQAAGTGMRQAAPLLDEKQVAEIIQQMKKEEAEKRPVILEWRKGTKTEKVDVPAGSFTCTYLEPEYSEEVTKQMSPAQIAELKSKSRLYFSEDVPRLLPFQIAMGWWYYIEASEEVKGGLVECKHMMGVELTAYSGQEK